MRESAKNVKRNQELSGSTQMVSCAYRGAAVGAVFGLVTLFVVVYVFGRDAGISQGDSAMLGSAMTLLLSQPAVAIGLLAGSVSGVIFGKICSRFHRHTRHTD